MKEVSLREFQLKASSYIGELPFVLTRYNKPIAIVVNPRLWEIIDIIQKYE